MTQTSVGRMQGKVVLVTGAGSVGPGWGNGRAITVRMVEEDALVYALDREPERLNETVALAQDAAKASGGEIDTGYCDVTQTASVAAAVATCLARYGHIDVLVNNVGGSASGGPVEMSEEVWDAQIDHNLKSVFLLCKHVLPHMEARGSGAIVNISSSSGMRWTGSPQVAYAASKAGVIQFGKVTALQYAKKGIRVNTVVPGQLHTPMVEVRLAKQSKGLGVTLKGSWRNDNPERDCFTPTRSGLGSRAKVVCTALLYPHPRRRTTLTLSKAAKASTFEMCGYRKTNCW